MERIRNILLLYSLIRLLRIRTFLPVQCITQIVSPSGHTKLGGGGGELGVRAGVLVAGAMKIGSFGGILKTETGAAFESAKNPGKSSLSYTFYNFYL
jgi:hypothetical protein